MKMKFKTWLVPLIDNLYAKSGAETFTARLDAALNEIGADANWQIMRFDFEFDKGALLVAQQPDLGEPASEDKEPGEGTAAEGNPPTPAGAHPAHPFDMLEQLLGGTRMDMRLMQMLQLLEVDAQTNKKNEPDPLKAATESMCKANNPTALQTLFDSLVQFTDDHEKVHAGDPPCSLLKTALAVRKHVQNHLQATLS